MMDSKIFDLPSNLHAGHWVALFIVIAALYAAEFPGFTVALELLTAGLALPHASIFEIGIIFSGILDNLELPATLIATEDMPIVGSTIGNCSD